MAEGDPTFGAIWYVNSFDVTGWVIGQSTNPLNTAAKTGISFPFGTNAAVRLESPDLIGIDTVAMTPQQAARK